METPYRKVVLKDGRAFVTKEIEYLNATIEDRKVIAHADIEIGEDGELLEEKLEARVKGKPSIIESTKVDFVDVSPNNVFRSRPRSFRFLNTMMLTGLSWVPICNARRCPAFFRRRHMSEQDLKTKRLLTPAR